MQKKWTSVLVAALLASVAGAANAETFVSADITSDTTWCDGVNTGPIILENPIFVEAGATLTILPGCIVRGQPRTLPANPVSPSPAGAPGALIVTQDGAIIADASASNPITFTTAAIDDNSDGEADRDLSGNLIPYTGVEAFFDATPTTAPLAPLDAAGASNVALWGGVVILGRAPTNLAEVCGLGATPPLAIPYGQCSIEGLAIPGFDLDDALYGGLETHDNSGVLRYVSIRHAGDEIADSNELNGLTLGGVGDGTIIENVEIYLNFDDGIEWFGGTVNGRNLSVTFAGDDSIDMDQGYTGTNQGIFVLMPFFEPVGTKHGDKIGELDGDDHGEGFNLNVRISTVDDAGATASNDDSAFPLSNPGIWNLTALGSTPDSQPAGVPATSPNDGVQMRNGFAGELINSVIVNTGSEEVVDVTDGDDAPGSKTENTAEENAAADLVRVVSTTYDSAVAGSDALAFTNGDTAVANGEYNAPSTATNTLIAEPLVNDDCIFDPGATVTISGLGGVCDPRLAAPADAVTPQENGLDRSATYRGAFQSGVDFWTDGWTAISQMGLF